ncbi:hypothetical protein BN000_05547 [Mycobacterium europaeum]|uniref:Transmembrane protein n=1 Tax=Mycobacterium europaeum TaxID=761804 RepID=A0A0U1DSX6_9MYCO|nr:hypothetical protein [Mycobacterium europaeum]CQD22257.1 hypothetical protein BN000_05547 [Mycobacterium europaeum]
MTVARCPPVAEDMPIVDGPLLLQEFFRYVGAPSCVISVLSIAFTYKYWRDFAVRARNTADRLHDVVERKTAASVRQAVILILSQAICVGVSYSLSMLWAGGFTQILSNAGAHDASVKQVLGVVISYNWWNTTTRWVVVAVTFGAIAMNVALAADFWILKPLLLVTIGLSLLLLGSAIVYGFIGAITIHSSVIDERQASAASLTHALLSAVGAVAAFTAAYTAGELSHFATGHRLFD